MTSSFSTAIIILCCVLVISCGSDNPASMDPNPDPNPDPSGNPNLVSKDIGANGGNLTSKDQRLTLIIPAGALGNTETITIEEIDTDQLGSEFDEIAADPGINKAYELGPDGLEFEMPIEVQFDSDQVVIQQNNEMGESVFIDLELLLTSENGEVAGLENLQMKIDEETGEVTITGELKHFSPLGTSKASGSATLQIGDVPNEIPVGDSFTVLTRFGTGDLPHELTDYRNDPESVIEPLFERPLEHFINDGSVSTSEFDFICNALGEWIHLTSLDARVEASLNNMTTQVISDILKLEIEKIITCTDPVSQPITTGLFDTPVERPEEIHWAIRHWFVAGFTGSNGVAIHDSFTGEEVQDFTESDPPTIGAQFANNTLITNGPGGIGTRIFDEEAGQFPEFQRLLFPTNPPNITHLVPIPAPGSNEPMGFFAADNSGNQVFRLDPMPGGDFELIDPPVLTPAELSVVTGNVLSIYSPEGEGPALGITSSNTPGTEGELFWFDPSGGSPKIQVVGNIGEGPRRIVCAPGGPPTACSVSDFTGQMLRFIDWQDRFDVPIIHESTIQVAGPVGIDMTFIDEQLMVLSPGFIDHSLHLITLDSDLTPSDQTIDLGAEGCENPGHAKFIPHEESTFLAVTCRDKYWVGTASGTF